MAAKARADPGWSQEPGVSSGSPMECQGPKALGHLPLFLSDHHQEAELAVGQPGLELVLTYNAGSQVVALPTMPWHQCPERLTFEMQEFSESGGTQQYSTTQGGEQSAATPSPAMPLSDDEHGRPLRDTKEQCLVVVMSWQGLSPDSTLTPAPCLPGGPCHQQRRPSLNPWLLILVCSRTSSCTLGKWTGNKRWRLSVLNKTHAQKTYICKNTPGSLFLTGAKQTTTKTHP